MPKVSGGVPALDAFEGRRVLMLQGPMGPFFRRLAHDLRQHGATVFKINFNAGDWLYFRDADCTYRGSLDQWPAFLEEYLTVNHIDTVMLYGDCRPVHEPVYDLQDRLGLEIFAFEEGYMRPDYITVERGRANGYSSVPRHPVFFLRQPPIEAPAPRPVGNTYWHMARHALAYHMAAWAGTFFGVRPELTYHRNIGVVEIGPQVTSLVRKVWHGITDRPLERRLMANDFPFFLVPLQVGGDSQVRRHSPYGGPAGGGVSRFIGDVVESFARHAPAETHLVFKHHPLDRGYNHHGALIRELARRFGVEGRVHYLVRHHGRGLLPALLDRALGVIVINSTVGLQAMEHGRPVKAMGTAIYDMQGLTAQVSLDAFWADHARHAPDPELYARFRAWLIGHTQVNGSFYRPLSDTGLRSGVLWPHASVKTAAGRIADAA